MIVYSFIIFQLLSKELQKVEGKSHSGLTENSELCPKTLASCYRQAV